MSADLALRLPDQLSVGLESAVKYIENVTTNDPVEALATADSGERGVIALSRTRFLFVWPIGGTKVKYVERARTAIVAAQVDGADLLVRDAQQLFRFKDVVPAERARDFAAGLQESGARTDAAPQPSDGPARNALRVVPVKQKAIVEQLLRSDENVHAVIVGVGKQVLVAADDRLLIVKKGWMAGATLGQKTLDFAYDQVSGIEMHLGALHGYLQITSPAFQANLPQSYWTSDKKHDPWKLPNCLPINRAQLKAMTPVLELIRERIAKGHWSDGIGGSAHSAEAPASPIPISPEGGSDLAGQLKELAELHGSGALSDEEFQQAKKKLLGSD